MNEPTSTADAAFGIAVLTAAFILVVACWVVP